MSEAESGKLYTLTQVSQQTKVSMPTLQRYKKLYQDRIPSKGTGRSQRYPEEALEVFRQLKKENIGRRGRPRKADSAAGAKKARVGRPPAKRGRRKKVAAKAAAAPKAGGKLLTLSECANRTGISYPTLLRYVKSNLDEIPHEGEGRSRRFLPGAVAVFKRLRSSSSRGRGRAAATAAATPAKRRGRPPKKAAAQKSTGRRRGRPPKSASESAISSRLKDLEKANKELERKLSRVEKQLAKPLKVVLQRR